MLPFQSLLLVCSSILLSTHAASIFSPARPPALPLAVKSPYLSTWINAGSDGGNGGYLAGQWPVHWTNQITGWSGMIRVDGETFQWMGNPGAPNVNQTSYTYTSTKSIFTMNVADKVQMAITFLSPVNPDDMKRQSLTFSYMQVAVSSTDGQSHDVQLYSDISGEWASGDHDATIQWEYHTSGNVAYHQVYRQTQIVFDENNKPDGNGMANWGNVYWATDRTSGLTVASGQDTAVRGTFISNGRLDGTQDTNYRAIQQNWPVFAFAIDLGSCGVQPSNTLFTIGLLQQPVIQFLGAQGLTTLPGLWTSYFGTEDSALTFFHGDFTYQQSQATNLDNMVSSDSVAAAGQDYLTITSLSVRQAFGALQLVGTTSQTYLFMKEISSNGNTQTVDVFFPMHPILLYFNPSLLKLMLDPLYENQESGHYPNEYAMHDLGAHYPNATGHPDGRDEEMPVEECGNMLIMTLAYAQRSNDVAYLKQHYQKLQQWTSFLVQDSLIPASQLSTDDFAGTLQNQTNLALKGIIGIQAMSEIARLTGNTADSKNYSSIATDYIDQWQVYGIARDANPPHTTLNYGANDTHGLLYNLWCDQELGLNLVPQSVYEMQSEFYPTIQNEFGVPLDTRHTYTKGDWEIFTASYCSPSTRDAFIKALANWINVTPTNRPLTDLYDTVSGDYPGILFVSRPVVGGTFALLVSNPQESNSGKCFRGKVCPIARPAHISNSTYPRNSTM